MKHKSEKKHNIRSTIAPPPQPRRKPVENETSDLKVLLPWSYEDAVVELEEGDLLLDKMPTAQLSAETPQTQPNRPQKPEAIVQSVAQSEDSKVPVENETLLSLSSPKNSAHARSARKLKPFKGSVISPVFIPAGIGAILQSTAA